MSDCPGERCDGRSVHEPPYRPDAQYYDYVDPDTGHAIRVDKIPRKGGGVSEVELCMTRRYRRPPANRDGVVA